MLTFSGDQQRFLLSHLISLALSLPYSYIPRRARNLYNFIPGVIIVYFCYGRQANLFLLYSAISFLACKYTPQNKVQALVLCISLAFLSFTHLSRQLLDYGGYKIDISGPYMIAVQKVTSLAFCIYDGFRLTRSEKYLTIEHTSLTSSEIYDEHEDTNNNDDSTLVPNLRKLKQVEDSKAKLYKDDPQNLVLTDEQSKYAVRRCPPLIEFMGYFFHYPSVCCGPIMYFNDYKDFVDFPDNEKSPPGRFLATFRKLLISIVSLLLLVYLLPKFDMEFILSDKFLIHTPALIKYWYLIVFTFVHRLKYYVAWHLGEASTNLTGLGFNGYDDRGRSKWDLASNMDIYKFETGLNLRESIHAWNRSTQTWLRRTAYERVSRRYHVLATYCLSAFWHGFYPGYYLTFLSGAIFTHAARSGRRVIKPYFVKGTVLPIMYDIITFILTRVSIAYIAFPFIILDFKNSWAIYKSLHFSLHILAFCMISIGVICKRR